MDYNDRFDDVNDDDIIINDLLLFKKGTKA
jgi:hypothetical protein